MKFLAKIVILGWWMLTSCTQQEEAKKIDVESRAIIEKSDQTEIVQKKTAREDKSYLSMEQAARRSARVGNVNYQLHFDLDGSEQFKATSEIDFDLNDTNTDLTLDLNNAKIESLVVNGTSIEINYNQWFITLPKLSLTTGTNNVVVKFTRLHSSNGEGLHRFVDSVDDKVYLYSHFEPAAAQQMFALFDQPDLKATFKLSVKTPADWKVISATREISISKEGNTKLWIFPQSTKLSPYNFSMHAGPYHVWENNHGKYPMRLFARQSIINKVYPDDWFKYTSNGLIFFENYFGIDYPFKKYDQILVPDFIYGAMENAAAITFAERSFVSSAAMDPSQKRRLASVIMHEMAHQWFGDLVTMKWWNGLWLNESFASFMGTLATAEATEFDYAWRNFYATSKQSAYRQDQRVTTHPIEVPIETSANAFDNIDAITYSKGASTLLQLHHLLGPEKFRIGIHNYLTEYAYGNATLNDFVDALAKSAGRPLEKWTHQWLNKADVNSIKVNFSCKQGKISFMNLVQSEGKIVSVLREQKVQIGLLYLNQNKLELGSAIPTIYKGGLTKISAAEGLECPDLVYPNYQDWGYVKVVLDAKSFATAKSSLNKVREPLLRSMLWQALYDRVEDGELAANLFLDLALSKISQETDYTVLGQAMEAIDNTMNYVYQLGDKGSSYVTDFQAMREQSYWSNATNIQLEHKLQLRWFDAYIDTASSHSNLQRLRKIISGNLSVKGIKLNQEQRWAIVQQLNRYEDPGSLTLIDQELERDPGDSGQKSALVARAIRPNIENKDIWFSEILNQNSELQFSKIRNVIDALFPSEQSDLHELQATRILAKLADIDATRTTVFTRSFNNLIPTTCRDASTKRLTNLLSSNLKFTNQTTRALLVARQEDEKCIRIGKLFLREFER